MNDLKGIIAKNIIDLRRQNGMTQAELAERLNYSDKAVSKWERGESVPDIAVLKSIADIFSVTVDFLITAEHQNVSLLMPKRNKLHSRNRKLILGMCLMLVWLIATFVFVLLQSILPDATRQWMCFIFAVPTTVIVWLVLNTIWFDTKYNFYIISALVWSILASVFLALLVFAGYNAWLLFFIGVPAQIIVILWSGIRITTKSKK